MLKSFKKTYYRMGAAFMVGALASPGKAFAQPGGGGGFTDNNFGQIAGNITDSISTLPGLLAALSYLFGILIGVLGVLKIKDHVENPDQTPLKQGAIRLAAGGALFALPIVFEAMANTVGDGEQIEIQKLRQVEMKTF